MVALKDFQFEIDGFAFGHGLPLFVDQSGFERGDVEVNSAEARNPSNGARMFGRDTRTGETWTWACHLGTDDEATALAAVEAAGARWYDEKYLEPEAVAALRYRINGRDRRVYGRPRRFSDNYSNALLQGNAAVLMTFDKSDPRHYDDLEQATEVRMAAPAAGGGFVVPFDAPLTVESPSTGMQPGAVVVGGNASTSPVVTFYGPSTNAKVVIGSFVVELEGTLGAGGTITVDARPWAQTIKRTGSASGVKVARTTRLARGVLKPGDYEAVYSGIDTSGDSKVRVAWRNAWHTF